jgi:hypothetical protein
VEDSLLAASIYEQLVEIPSVSVQAAETILSATAMRLRAGGFRPRTSIAGRTAQIRRAPPRTDSPPLLLLASSLIVPRFARTGRRTRSRSSWDGWWYGRGTEDNKAGAAILVTNLIRAKHEGFVPDRDWIVVLTSDEETESAGIQWLVTEGRQRIGDPEFALNTDSGGGIVRGGRETMFVVQASEKVYLTFDLEVTDKGGHSSIPTADNAIDALARGLARLADHRFPVALNEVTRGFFERSLLEEDALAADMRAVAADPPDSAAATRLSESPYYNALLRTTCTATRLEAATRTMPAPTAARR